MNSPVMWICEKLLAVTIMVTLPANTDRNPSGYLWPPVEGGLGVEGRMQRYSQKRGGRKGFYCLSLCSNFY